MVLSVRNKIRSMSVNGYGDQSKIKTETNVPINYDDFRRINYVELTRIPKGDIISCVISFINNTEDAVVDGIFNIAGTRIDFLPDVDMSGNKAEIKYLI